MKKALKKRREFTEHQRFALAGLVWLSGQAGVTQQGRDFYSIRRLLVNSSTASKEGTHSFLGRHLSGSLLSIAVTEVQSDPEPKKLIREYHRVWLTVKHASLRASSDALIKDLLYASDSTVSVVVSKTRMNLKYSDFSITCNSSNKCHSRQPTTSHCSWHRPMPGASTLYCSGLHYWPSQRKILHVLQYQGIILDVALKLPRAPQLLENVHRRHPASFKLGS